MSDFFLVSSFDKISSEMTALLINTHPDIECKIVSDDSLFPQSTNLFLDEFIKHHLQSNHLFVDNIYNYRALECNFVLDSITLITQKWIRVTGDWSPCFGSDNFQPHKPLSFFKNHLTWPIKRVELNESA